MVVRYGRVFDPLHLILVVRLTGKEAVNDTGPYNHS
jgi:hypothetical protein